MQFSIHPEEIDISPLSKIALQNTNLFSSDNYRKALLNHIDHGMSPSRLSLLQQVTRLDFFSYLPDDVLVKVDRASMLSSLEVRSPILDYRIAEFAFGLPDKLRFDGGIRKLLLKKIARKYLPADFPFERKQGFSLPEAEWIKGPWRQNIESIADRSDLLDKEKVQQISRLHQKTGRCGKTLFSAVMLAKWQCEYLGCD